MKNRTNPANSAGRRPPTPASAAAAGLILAAFCLVSCATMLPPPEDPSSTLLVFSVDTRIPTGLNMGAKTNLIIGIEGVERTVTLRPGGSPMVFVTDLPPGSHSTATVQQQTKASGDWHADTGLTPPEEFKVRFELEPRTITVFPVRFVYVVEQVRQHHYTSSWVLEDMSEADDRELLDRLKTQDNFDRWRNAYNIR